MKIILDFDDFSILNNRLDLLLQLKDYYPGLKVSMFTIPFDYRTETKTTGRIMRESELKKIKANLDWIQIIPHGLAHLPREFERADYEATKMALKAIDEAFDRNGLPYEKGFKAPYWLWNRQVIDVLNEEGWWGAVDPRQEMLKPKKFYRYEYTIDEPFWEVRGELLRLHGHIAMPDRNNLEDCFMNLMKMDRKAEFGYVTDYLEE